MSAGAVLDVVYALLVDGVVFGVDKHKVLEVLDRVLATPVGANAATATREQWGTGPQAEAGQRAMMALAPRRERRPKPQGGGTADGDR